MVTEDKTNLYLRLLVDEIVKSSKKKALTDKLEEEFGGYLRAINKEDIPTMLKIVSKTSFFAGAFAVIRMYIVAREEYLEEGVDSRMDNIQEEIVQFFRDIHNHLHDTIGSDVLESIPAEAFGKHLQ